MFSKIFMVALPLIALSGCGTIVRGTTEDIAISATPPHAHITTTMGQTCTGSCVVKVSRKDSFTVTAQAEGYESQSVPVQSRMSGEGAAGMAGNILVGGIIGIGVDAFSGATLDHYPNPVRIDLEPVSGPRSYEPPRIQRRETAPYARNEEDAPRRTGGYRYDDRLGLVRN